MTISSRVRFLFALCIVSAQLLIGPLALGIGFRKMPRVAMAQVPMVGDSIPAPHTSFQCVVNAAQTYPCFEAVVNRITYQVAYTGEGPLFQVTDVRTIALAFVSSDGLKINDVISINSRDDLILAPYYAVYANRGRVWVPIIGFLDNVSVVGADGKEKEVQIKELRFDEGAIRVRITGFVQRKGVEP